MTSDRVCTKSTGDVYVLFRPIPVIPHCSLQLFSVMSKSLLRGGSSAPFVWTILSFSDDAAGRHFVDAVVYPRNGWINNR